MLLKMLIYEKADILIYKQIHFPGGAGKNY